MPLLIRDYETMVTAVLERIITADVGITNTSRGTITRAFVESVISEVDMGYYQLNYVNLANRIDTAIGDDLDAVVAILNVIRDSATTGKTTVKLSRGDAASQNYPINAGSLVSTRQDSEGNVIEFEVANDYVLNIGESEIDVEVSSVVAGQVNLPIGAISVIVTPINGITTVTNEAIVSLGSDRQTDDSLRDEAKNAFEAAGNATYEAVRSALLAVDGVSAVTITDLHAGVGTAQGSITTEQTPAPSDVVDAIDAVVFDKVSLGIDFTVVYPTTQDQDITMTVSDITQNSVIVDAVNEHFLTLAGGQTLIVSQLESKIILAFNDPIFDISITVPAANVTPGDVNIVLRAGVITINGVIQ